MTAQNFKIGELESIINLSTRNTYVFTSFFTSRTCSTTNSTTL